MCLSTQHSRSTSLLLLHFATHMALRFESCCYCQCMPSVPLPLTYLSYIKKREWHTNVHGQSKCLVDFSKHSHSPWPCGTRDSSAEINTGMVLCCIQYHLFQGLHQSCNIERRWYALFATKPIVTEIITSSSSSSASATSASAFRISH
jgi:hypothetical protein